MCARAAPQCVCEPALRYRCVTSDMPDADAASRCGCSSADSAAWRACLAEMCGSALLVLLGCLGAPPAAPLLQRALAAGLVVTVLVQTLDHVSGAFFNPSVLLAAALWGRVGPARALAKLCAQLAGATLGAVALSALRPGAATACVTRPQQDLALYEAVVVEALLSGCLALANCGTWDTRTATLRDSWPLRIGLSVAALSLVGGELTGASMNPARSFGPALCSGDWTHHWVYWVGPLSGSLASTLLYMAAWRPRAVPPTAHCLTAMS